VESIPLLQGALDALKRLSSSKQLGEPKLRRMLEEAASSLELVLREISVDNVELARLINSKAGELESRIKGLKPGALPRDVVAELERLVKWCKMAPYDFTDRIKYVRRGYRYYLWGMILFFITAGTYAQIYAVSAMLLALPAIMGMSFMKKRRATGLMLAFASMPLPIAIFSWIISYIAYAFTSSSEVEYIASEYGITMELAYLILLLYLVAATLGIILLSMATYLLYRNRHAFA